MWEDQRIVARPRYRDLISALRFVARQELIFGMHVHVGVDDPDKAIHVANGMRVHMPVLLGLSANSPFWRADATGMASTRTPIFRAFPRVGIPPTYEDWEDYERRIEFMINAGVIEDYTYLWHDVRPHPMFGTVEVRVMDSQTHVEHSLGLAALVQALVRELAEHFESGQRLSRYPFEMLDENKWLAARHGLEGELVDLPSSDRVATRALARRLIDRMREHCQDLGSEAELEAVEDLLARGNGAARQVVVYEANHDLREVMAEIVAATRARSRQADRPTASAAGAPARFYNRFVSTGGQELFVVCKSCGSEVSPYITECPYCGNRLRKRAPKLDREGRPPRRAAPQPARRCSPACAATRSPGSAPTPGPTPRSPWSWPAWSAPLLWRTSLGDTGNDLRSSRQARLALVAAVHRRCSPTTTPATPSSPSAAIGLFGWLLERRHGPLAVLGLFLVGGVGGLAATTAVYPVPFALGAERRRAGPARAPGRCPTCSPCGPARTSTATCSAWRRSFAVLVLMPLAVTGASWVADGVGVAVGLVVGLPLARLAVR